MSPEERLEALGGDARWHAITLYPEHGRMPAPVRPHPWRVLAGTAAVLVAVAAVFGGIAFVRGSGVDAGPAPIAGGTQTATVAPAIGGATGGDLFDQAELPPGAMAGALDSVPAQIPLDGTVCGVTSHLHAFWALADTNVEDVMSWFSQNRPQGLPAGIDLTRVDLNGTPRSVAVLQAPSTAAPARPTPPSAAHQA